jgi:hypothetical protein
MHLWRIRSLGNREAAIDATKHYVANDGFADGNRRPYPAWGDFLGIQEGLNDNREILTGERPTPP